VGWRRLDTFIASETNIKVIPTLFGPSDGQSPSQIELESYLIARNLSDVTKFPDRKPFQLGQVQSAELYRNDFCQRGKSIGSRHINELRPAVFLISRTDDKNLAPETFQTFGERKIEFACLTTRREDEPAEIGIYKFN
jgi:hypothetical protein